MTDIILECEGSPMTRARIVFLDFDGVLNTPVYRDAEWTKSGGYFGYSESGLWCPSRYLEESKIVLLNQLLERAGACVVLSTSWRQQYSVSDIREFLTKRGFVGEIVGRTPRLSGWNDDGPQTRGHEIRQWLLGQDVFPSWVALDDLAQEYMGPVRGPRFIQTDENVGLTQELVDRAVQVLAEDP